MTHRTRLNTYLGAANINRTHAGRRIMTEAEWTITCFYPRHAIGRRAVTHEQGRPKRVASGDRCLRPGRLGALCSAPRHSPKYAAMSQAEQNLRIDYIEFAAVDLPALKQFYQQVFGWRFTDYGPHYSSFTDGRLTGGFTTDSAVGAGPLVVIYATDLEGVCAHVAAAGGQITQEIFSFPGGRRFAFSDPSGNRLAVWSE
jgi:hypothetical protein